MAPSSLHKIYWVHSLKQFISINPPSKAGILPVLEIRKLKVKKAIQLVSGRTKTQLQICLPLIPAFYHLSHIEPD